MDLEGVFAIIGVFSVVPVTVWAVSAYRHKTMKATAEVMKAMVEKFLDLLQLHLLERFGNLSLVGHDDADEFVAFAIFSGSRFEEAWKERGLFRIGFCFESLDNLSGC